ncbi:MAG TPA: fumarylacetoacetate hydrolase family protein [Terriglobales bacterium]|nr:fumarylacetoacetate hydrolase family protein [Terriglobales bacterium]
MKIIRYQDAQGSKHHGALSADGSARKIKGDIFSNFEVTEEPADVRRLLAPVVPAMIWCVGQNYRRHAQESGATAPELPIIFAKGPNTLQDPGQPILIPTHLASNEVDYECELAVIIGSPCKNATRSNALDYVLGYTCANDVSARDWQIKRGGSQWCRGKTFDTFAPMGPCLVTKDSLPNPNQLKIQTILNGKVMQDWTTSDMIFNVPTLIEFLSGSTTLLPGTIILTGTPHGVGMAQKPPRWLHDGDEVSIVIENIGTLTNPVRTE